MEQEEWEDVQTKRPEPKYVELKVTIDHINKATRRSFNKDPVSIAIQETLKCNYAVAGWGYANSYLSDLRTSWTLWPFTVIRDFMRDWDRGKEVKPIELRMYKDSETDKSPKQYKRKLPRQKNFTDLQIEAQRKLNL